MEFGFFTFLNENSPNFEKISYALKEINENLDIMRNSSSLT